MSWIDLLRQAVSERGMASIARDLTLSRTTVHMVLKGTYKADTRNVEQKVLELFGKAACPFLGRILDAQECRWYREREVPMSHHREIEHWQACQKCDAPIVPEAPAPDEG